MAKLVGDITKPHLRKILKMVPLRDENGNIIEPKEIQHGGPWAPVRHGMKIGEDDSKT